jgi:uncharacterized membrane protein
MSDRRFVVVTMLVGLSAVVVGLLVFRMLYADSTTHAALLWNLVLAWVPFVLALLVYDRAERHRPRSVVLAALLWLLFLPNAPYIVTDFVHLRGSTGLAWWFDLILIGTVATTGLLLGVVSLYLVHAVVRRAAGAAVGWGFVGAALALSSLGVYVGRVWRWNSWDPVVRPAAAVERLATAFASPHPRAVGFMIVFTVFLALAYGAFYAVARGRLSPERVDRRR